MSRWGCRFLLASFAGVVAVGCSEGAPTEPPPVDQPVPLAASVAIDADSVAFGALGSANVTKHDDVISIGFDGDVVKVAGAKLGAIGQFVFFKRFGREIDDAR